MSETRLKVLVVDDEVGIQKGCERVLQDFSAQIQELEGYVNYSVLTTGTGEDGLELIEKTTPDIVFLDYKLPGISGLDVLANLLEKKKDMLVVMITAYATLETAVTATKQGAFDFLAKPFTPDELRSVVTKATRNLILQRQTRKLAEEKRQVRFQFISVVAHELKAPLAAIEGYLNIMNDGLVSDPATTKQMVERCVLRLTGMRKMVTDLLDFTRIESGNKVREFENVNISEIAKLSIEMMTADAKEKEVTIELHSPGVVTMTADRGELEIILNNLVSNAVKYNRKNGRVDVYIEDFMKNVTIRVRDTGIGMTKDEANKLFGEFVRIKNKKTSNILGTGLGLSIVKKLAQLYGGNVTVTSEPDVGTMFTVTLSKEVMSDEQEKEEAKIGA
jgi:signal transduction histidine kinase